MKSTTMPTKLPVHKVSMGNAWRVAACGLDMMGKKNWRTNGAR